MSRLIDADALKTKKYHSEVTHENAVAVAEIDWMPTIDAVQVVRCKDCKHSYDAIGGTFCSYGTCVDCVVDEDFYCAYGERRDNGKQEVC